MASARPSGVRAVGVGVVVTVVALAAKTAIVQLVGQDVAYLTLLAGIPVASLLGGFGAGAVVVVLGALAEAAIFQSPPRSLSIADPAAAARFVLFVPIGLWLAWLVAAVGDSRRSAAVAAGRFESVLSELPDFAMLVDPTTRLIEYCSRSVSTLGWAPEALVGLSVDRVMTDLGDLRSGLAGVGPEPGDAVTERETRPRSMCALPRWCSRPGRGDAL